MSERKQLGGPMAQRPLHIIYILDCSSSMNEDGKIQMLNTGIRETIPAIIDKSKENANVEVLVRVIKFSNGAQWHIADPTPIEDFIWEDLTANGVTEMGKAFSMVAEQLETPPMESRMLPPVLLLISDGMPTDDYKIGLKELMDKKWGQKSVRLSIGIGSGDKVDYSVLKRFNGGEIDPFKVEEPEKIKEYIKLSSTIALTKSMSTKEIHLPSDDSEDISSSDVEIPSASDNNSKSSSFDDELDF